MGRSIVPYSAAQRTDFSDECLSGYPLISPTDLFAVSAGAAAVRFSLMPPAELTPEEPKRRARAENLVLLAALGLVILIAITLAAAG